MAGIELTGTDTSATSAPSASDMRLVIAASSAGTVFWCTGIPSFAAW